MAKIVEDMAKIVEGESSKNDLCITGSQEDIELLLRHAGTFAVAAVVQGMHACMLQGQSNGRSVTCQWHC